MLKYHADVDFKNKDGNTALFIASQSGHALCVKVLLEHNADIYIQNRKGETAYCVAKTNDIRKMVNR